MGAADFYTVEEGRNVEEAFRTARENALYEYGHGGYTGTIAEKNDYVEIPLKGVSPQRRRKLVIVFSAWSPYGPAEHVARAFASARLRRTPELEEVVRKYYGIFDDKWGPCLAINTGRNRWIFFGYAST